MSKEQLIVLPVEAMRWLFFKLTKSHLENQRHVAMSVEADPKTYSRTWEYENCSFTVLRRPYNKHCPSDRLLCLWNGRLPQGYISL